MALLQAALAVMVISGADPPALLDFYSDSCGPCRAMDPAIQALIAKGYPVRRVNVERERALAAQYRVTNIPCFVMVVDGREVDRVVGGTTFSRLERMCKAGLAQNQGPPQLAQAGPAGPGPSIPVPPMESAPPASVGVPPPPTARPTALPPGTWPPAQALPAATVAEGRLATPVSLPRTSEPALTDEGLIAASVRLRIEDPAGHSCGSGTIIDARGGKALILTCGHIFRDSQGKGRIEVDLFGPYAGQRVAGEMVDYDAQRDLGLVCIRTPGPVATTPVAPPGYRIGQGEPVVSVGCNNGNPPTAVRSRVASLNKFLGPPNVQVAGQPIEGRSGGGLFSNDGLVIGVCNAADPGDREGFFAALDSIHALLDRAGLSFAYRPAGQNSVAQAAPVPRGMLVPVDPPVLPPRMPDPLGASAASSAVASSGQQPRLSKDEQAALDEIRRRLQEGAEVICVVRSRQNPQANSEVIMLDKVSPDFVRQLAADARTQEPRHLTSLEIPRKREAAGGSTAAEPGGLPPRAVPATQSSPATAWPAPVQWSGAPGNWDTRAKDTAGKP